MSEKQKVFLSLFNAVDIGVNIWGNLQKGVPTASVSSDFNTWGLTNQDYTDDLTINSAQELKVKVSLDSLIWALKQLHPEIRDRICLDIDPIND